MHGDLMHFHVPNGGSRNIIEATKLKKMGVRPGVSDIIICHPKKTQIAFIELKVGKNKLTDSQKLFIKVVEKLGHFTALVRSLDEFKEVLRMFLQG